MNKMLGFLDAKLSVLDNINLIKKFNENRSKIVWIHIGDLLIPPNGQLTGGQILIASRVLDWESEAVSKNDHYMWQIRMAEIGGRRLDEVEKKCADNIYIELEASIKERGYLPLEGELPTIVNGPIALNNGTHRVSFLIKEKENVIIACWLKSALLTNKRLRPWFGYDGEQYWRTHGIDENELAILKNKYDDILGRIRTYLTGVCRKEKWIIAKKMINCYGEIVDENEIMVLSDSIYVRFHFRCYQWAVTYKRGRLRSAQVKELNRKLSCKLTRKWGYLAESVTESIEFEKRIAEEQCF